MKGLAVSHVRDFSGAEIILEKVVLAVSGIDWAIIAPAGKYADRLSDRGLKIYRCQYLDKLFRAESAKWLLKLPYTIVRTSFDIYRVAKVERVDFIHANNLAAAFYAFLPFKLLRKPLFWHAHDIYADNIMNRFIVRNLARRVTKVIAVSEAVKQNFISLGAPAENIVVIYNGIDIDGDFNPLKHINNYFRKRYNYSESWATLGFIGLLESRKGLDDLLSALAKINKTKRELPLKLFVIGGRLDNKSKDYEEKLRQQITSEQLDQHVHFLGKAPVDQIPDIMRSLDLLVVPSKKPDPLPTVILEAMALETPVLASNTGGIPEIIDHGINGLLFPSGNINKLIDVLHVVIDGNLSLKEMGKLARIKMARSFSMERSKNCFFEFYRAFAGKHENIK